MKKYRIKQIIRGDENFYYPQERHFGFLWLNISLFGEYFSDFGCCESFLKSHIKSKKKATVDYFYYGDD
jgi:hypothetical protein